MRAFLAFLILLIVVWAFDPGAAGQVMRAFTEMYL